MTEEPTIGNLLLELAERCSFVQVSRDIDHNRGLWCVRVHVQLGERGEVIYDQNLLAALVAALAWAKGPC